MTIADRAVLVTGANRGIGLGMPKASREAVSRAILDGVENGEDEIFPDPVSQSKAAGWRGGAAKALERQQASFVAAEPVSP